MENNIENSGFWKVPLDHPLRSLSTLKEDTSNLSLEDIEVEKEKLLSSVKVEGNSILTDNGDTLWI